MSTSKVINHVVKLFLSDSDFEVGDYLRCRDSQNNYILRLKKHVRAYREDEFFFLWSVYMNEIKVIKKLISFLEYSYIFKILF